MPPDSCVCVLPSESQCDPERASQRSGFKRLDCRSSPSSCRCEFWRAGAFDWMAELFLGALQSPAELLAVFLSLSPVEVDPAETSCHLFSCVACQLNEANLRYSRTGFCRGRGMCLTPGQMWCGSVCAPLKVMHDVAHNGKQDFISPCPVCLLLPATRHCLQLLELPVFSR